MSVTATSIAERSSFPGGIRQYTCSIPQTNIPGEEHVIFTVDIPGVVEGDGVLVTSSVPYEEGMFISRQRISEEGVVEFAITNLAKVMIASAPAGTYTITIFPAP